MTRSERIARIRASSATSAAPAAASVTNNAKTPINNNTTTTKPLKATPLLAGSTADSLEKMMNQSTKAELMRLLRSAWGEVATRRNEILTLRAVVANLRQDLAHYHATGLPRGGSSISSGALMTTFTTTADNNNRHNNNNNLNIVNNRNTSSTPRARHSNEDPYFFLSSNPSRIVSPTPAAGHMPPAAANGLVTPIPMSMQEPQYHQQQQYQQQQQQGELESSVTTTATTAMMMGDMDMMDGQGEEELDPLLEELLNEQGGVEGVGEEGGLMAEFVMHWGGSEGENGKEEEKPVGIVGMSMVVNELSPRRVGMEKKKDEEDEEDAEGKRGRGGEGGREGWGNCTKGRMQKS